jgi:ankyrin repeat protein
MTKKNIVLKRVFFGVFLTVVTFCVYSKDQQSRQYPVLLCEKAQHGTLDIKNTPTSDPHINAYLLDCAVSVVISEVSSQSGPRKGNKTRNKNKKTIADHFLSHELDMNFKNSDGDNLLMSVITSFLPESWKEKAVIFLLDKGIDKTETNNNGDIALDIARFKGNERIIKLLSN